MNVVFDCNVFLQALANPGGPAGRCVELALQGRVALFISTQILEEIRRVVAYPKTRNKLKLRDDRIELLLDNLPKAATLVPMVIETWTFERDPDDAHYVNLALTANARLVVSRDKDLLDLMNASTPDAMRLMSEHPDFRVLTPTEFLANLHE